MNEVRVNSYDLSRLTRVVADVSAQQAQIAGKVNQVAVAQDATRSELGDLRQQFAGFLQKDALDKSLTKAQNSLQLVKGEFKETYGHYDDVRRRATGILQALDSGIVTKATIYQVTEEFMIGTPRYWLAPALVALAAWVSDDRVLAERALAEAVRREPGKTSLFFTLVLRRNGRTEATARWLRQYVAGQDPAALPREFTVVLDAVATGAFGPEARPVVLDHLGEWYARLRTDQDVVQAQVARWETLIGGKRRPEKLNFPVLKEISPTWPTLRDIHAGATVFEQGSRFLHGIFDGPLPVTDLAQRVDDILDKLVTKYDDEERPIRTKMAELEAIIAHEGDEEAASKDVKAQEPLRDERFDVMTLLTNAAFFPEQVGASLATQRLAVALTGEWAIEATGRLAAANTAAVPDAVQLSIDDWHGAIDASSTEAGLVASVTGHIRQRTDEAVAATGIGGDGVLAIVAGIASLMVSMVAAVNGGLVAAVFLLLAVVACGGWTYALYKRRDRRRADLRQAGERQVVNAAAKVNGAIAEARDWWDMWQKELANSEQLRTYLSGLVQDAYVGAAHSREVLS
jgi:hypothetical protein